MGCTGSTQNAPDTPQQQRTRNPPGNPQTSTQQAGQSRGVATPIKGVPGSSAANDNSDLIGKLGTSLQDRRDAADVIKKHLADGPDADYLKHIIDETSEHFIDVRSNLQHLDDREIRERRSEYDGLLTTPVNGQLAALSLPTSGNPDALAAPVSSLEWLAESSSAIEHSVANIQLRKTQDIVVSFNSVIATQ